MRNLGVVCSALLLAFGFAAACAGDEKVRHLAEGGAAGAEPSAAGAGAGPVSHGGGSSDPSAGQGGVAPVDNAAGVGGLPPVAEGGGGVGGEAMLPQGGAAGATGAGGAGGALDCPAEMGTFTHQCAEVAQFWAPVWNPTASRFEFDPSNLPFPIASGTVTYFYSGIDSQQCGTASVVMVGDLVTVPIVLQFPAVLVRISTFSFVDVCGNTHDYDAVGAPSCFDLRSTVGAASTPLACFNRFTALCPEGCS